MKTLALTLTLSLATGTVLAEGPVGIAKDMPSVTVQTEDGPVEINRI